MVKSAADGPKVAQLVQSISEASPFILQDIDPVGPQYWNCTFVIAKPDLVVGFRSVTELLSRLALDFEVYRVERVVGPARSIAS